MHYLGARKLKARSVQFKWLEEVSARITIVSAEKFEDALAAVSVTRVSCLFLGRLRFEF